MTDERLSPESEESRPAQRAQGFLGTPTVGWSIAGSAVGGIWALVALLNHHALLGVVAALYLAMSLARLIYALRIRRARRD